MQDSELNIYAEEDEGQIIATYASYLIMLITTFVLGYYYNISLKHYPESFTAVIAFVVLTALYVLNKAYAKSTSEDGIVSNMMIWTGLASFIFLALLLLGVLVGFTSSFLVQSFCNIR